MTVLLRSEGIPARYVTGFLPGEYNDVGGDYTFAKATRTPGWKSISPPTAGLPSIRRLREAKNMAAFSIASVFIGIRSNLPGASGW